MGAPPAGSTPGTVVPMPSASPARTDLPVPSAEPDGTSHEMPWPDFLSPAEPGATADGSGRPVVRQRLTDEPGSAPAPPPGAPGRSAVPAVPPAAPVIPGLPAADRASAVDRDDADWDAAIRASAAEPPVAGSGHPAAGAESPAASPAVDQRSSAAAGDSAATGDLAVAGDLAAAGDLAGTGDLADTGDSEPLPGPAFSPVALRILGAQRSTAQLAEKGDMPVQRHQVALGDDRIEVVLTEAPAGGHDGKSRGGHTWLTATPYLVWTPLPYDAPDGGTAFACLGAGDEGCLFIDLAAAPGAIAIGGDRAAATRLAESIAHQLSLAAISGQPVIVIVVGDVLPEPFPAGAASVAELRDLASAQADGPSDAAEIVFCELRSNEDAFALARYVGSAQRRVIPVVLANLPSAPWSFTAQPSLRPSETLHPAVG
jgi:hypothetical protein